MQVRRETNFPFPSSAILQILELSADSHSLTSEFFEILNLTNTPKFGGISSTSFDSSTFGRVNQQVGFMRIWQISFRLTY